jgi:hypothetical protein
MAAGIGGASGVRDRPGEFSERRAIPKPELFGRLDDVVLAATQALSKMTPGEMLRERRIQDGPDKESFRGAVGERTLRETAHEDGTYFETTASDYLFGASAGKYNLHAGNYVALLSALTASTGSIGLLVQPIVPSHVPRPHAVPPCTLVAGMDAYLSHEVGRNAPVVLRESSMPEELADCRGIQVVVPAINEPLADRNVVPFPPVDAHRS